MPDHVTIFEVGPRDGLQNEKQPIATADKIRLVDMLSATGLSRIEVTSFVSAKWVPQLADAAEVMAGITRAPNVTYAVLTPNMRGFEAALQANADEIAVFASASEGFSRANINCSIAESIARFEPVIARAKEMELPVRGYVSCVTDCPYDGPVSPDNVARVTRELLDLGCYEISLGDTIGAATPEKVDDMLDVVLAVAPAAKLAGHFHDTHGRALDNIAVCLHRGLRVFDAAVGGLGSCPYAPGATGNVSTEHAVDFLEAGGFSRGIDRNRLREAVRFAERLATLPEPPNRTH